MRSSLLVIALSVIMSVFLCGCAPGKGRYKVKIQPPSGSKDNSGGYIIWKDYKKHYKECDVTNYQELLDYAAGWSCSKTNANNLFIYAKDTKTVFEVVSDYYLIKRKDITSEEDYYNGLAPKIVFVGPKTKTEYFLIALPGVDTDIPFITQEIVKKEGIECSNLADKTLCWYDPGKIFPRYSLREVRNYSELSYKNKINAFLRLCQHLGAKSVKLSYFTDDKTSMGGDFKVNAQGQGGGSIGGKYEEQLQRLFACNAKFEGKPIKGPLPESIWDNEFSDFVARRQHENRLLREEMVFEYSESMGISGDIQLQIKNVGINIGLSMNKGKRYKCVYIVEF